MGQEAFCRANSSPGYRREDFLVSWHAADIKAMASDNFSGPPWYSAVLPALRKEPCCGQDPSYRLHWLLHTPPTHTGPLCCPWDACLLFQLPFPPGLSPGPLTTCLTKCPNEPRRELLTVFLRGASAFLPSSSTLPAPHPKLFLSTPPGLSQGLWWPLFHLGGVWLGTYTLPPLPSQPRHPPGVEVTLVGILGLS